MNTPPPYGMENFSSEEEFKIQYALGTVNVHTLHEVVMDDETSIEVIKYLVSSCKEADVCAYIIQGWNEWLTYDDILEMLKRHSKNVEIFKGIVSRPKYLEYTPLVDALLDTLLEDFPKYAHWVSQVVNAIGRRDIRFHAYKRIIKAADLFTTISNEGEAVLGKALTALFFAGEVTLKEE